MADIAETSGTADREGAEPEAASGPGPLQVLLDRLTAIEAQLADHHRRAAHREAVIDRLHAENQELRGGLRRAILEPAVADLIRLHDALRHEAARLDAGPAGLVRSFADDVELILDRCGVEAFTAEPGQRYRPGEHRPVAVVPTPDPELDDTLVEVLAVGFREREGGRVRRPLQARFHRHAPAERGDS